MGLESTPHLTEMSTMVIYVV